MKKRLLIILAVGILCFTSLLFVSCNNGSQNQRSNGHQRNKDIENCLKDLKSGLQTRWDLERTSLSDYYLKCAQTELNVIKKYEDYNFSDKKFKEIINEYINSLNSQIEGVKYLYTNGAKFEKIYLENGYDVRKECLTNLCEKYSFKVDKKYKDKLDDVLKNKRYKAINVGETVEIETEYGKLRVSVDGAKKSNWNEREDMEEGCDAVLLNCTVENISYESPYNGDYVDAEDFNSLEDKNGNTISTYGTAYGDGNLYSPKADGFWSLPQGKKSKVGIPYIISEDNEYVLSYLEGKDQSYQVAVKIEK